MRVVVGVLAGVLLAGGASTATALPDVAVESTEVVASKSATAKRTSPARGVLVVRTRLLGKAKQPRVRIVGRRAPKRPVRVGQRVRLPAGTYTLIATPVKTVRGMRHTTTKRVKVRVRSGKVTRATLRYRVLVPARTRVVAAGAAREIRAVTARSLRMPSTRAKTLRRGSIIVAGVTPATPNGLLRKVVSKKVSGSTTTIRTAPATLREAVPEGAFSLRIGEDGAVVGSGMMERGAHEHARVTLSRKFEINQAWGAGESAGGCSFEGTGLRANAVLTPKATAEVSAEWRLLGTPKVSVDSAIGVDGAVSIEGGVTGSCSLVKRTPAVRFAPITVFAGPVPVVLTPALSASAKLEVSASFKARVAASLTGRLTGGFTYDRGVKYRDGNTLALSPTTLEFDGAAGAAELSATPELSLLVYGAAGPKLGLSAGVSGNVRSTGSPWWNVDANIAAEMGVKFDALGLKVDASHSFAEKTWRLADSGDAPAPGSSPPGDAPPAAAVGVPVVSCPLTFHPFLPEDRNPIPATLSATLPPDAVSRVRFFSNGDVSLLAPADYGCTSITGGNGTMKMLVAPGTPRFTEDGGTKPERALYAYVFFNRTDVFNMACPYFEKARARADGPCTRPPGETVTVVDETTVRVTSAPGVSGLGYPSGGPLTARSVLVFDDGNGPAMTALATCTLPESDAPICDAALTAFAETTGG